MKLPALLTLLCLPAACDEFATPADLDRPQILAIRSVPASVGVGESATLSILVADQDGPILTPAVSWSVVTEPGSPGLGSIVTNSDSAVYTAPSTLEGAPTVTSIEATVGIGDLSLTGVKAMFIGGPSLANPQLDEVYMDGQSVSESVTIPTGSSVTLSISIEGLSEEATFSWYGRPGTIAEYRSAFAQYQAPDEPGEGWIFIVVRDLGGISYRYLPLQVE